MFFVTHINLQQIYIEISRDNQIIGTYVEAWLNWVQLGCKRVNIFLAIVVIRRAVYVAYDNVFGIFHALYFTNSPPHIGEVIYMLITEDFMLVSM